MKITRENVSDLELIVKVVVESSDYADAVNKQLKDYQHKATLPGFRKGMAPMGLIKRHYLTAVVSDAVMGKLNTELFKYIDEEKLQILGMPMMNDEKTGTLDFSTQSDYTFYFDAAVSPEFDIDWSKVDVKQYQIKLTPKEIDNEITSTATRYGKFETPAEVGKDDMIYGKLVELDKDGNAKEGGVDTFVSLNLKNLKSEESLPLFEGKKVEDKIVFNFAKTFPTADIERALHMENADAKKFKADVEMTISGISRIIPHEINEELYKKVFPEKEIKDADAFRKAIHEEIDKANAEQSDYLFVNQVRKALLEQFTASLPENFLKRWFASRGEKEMTMENIEANWESSYVPSLKWEIIEQKLESIKAVEPTYDQIVAYIKDILATNDTPQEGETPEQISKRLEDSARSIAADRNNIRGVIDRLYAQNLATIFKEQIKPETEKVSSKEFAEKAKNE